MYDHFNAHRKVGLSQSAVDKRVGPAGLSGPIDHFAVVPFDVDVHPPVRIDPFHFGHHAPQRDRLSAVELGGEGVMGEGRSEADGHRKQDEETQHSSFHRCIV